jgi:hypothetical protein
VLESILLGRRPIDDDQSKQLSSEVLRQVPIELYIPLSTKKIPAEIFLQGPSIS